MIVQNSNGLLHICTNNNDAIDHLIPQDVKYLYISGLFNQPLNNLPQSLIKLHINGKFNQSVDNLPSGLIELELGGDFNQPVDKLPSKLRILIFNWSFNQSIDNLPSSLKLLKLSIYFNKPINKLPPNLTNLSMNKFDQLTCELPLSLTHFTVFDDYSKNIRLSFFAYYLVNINIPNIIDQRRDVYDRCRINKYNIRKRQCGLFDDLLEKID